MTYQRIGIEFRDLEGAEQFVEHGTRWRCERNCNWLRSMGYRDARVVVRSYPSWWNRLAERLRGS